MKLFRRKETRAPLDKEARKRRRERIIIVLALIFLAGFTYVEVVFLHAGFEGPTFNSVFFFALVNLNVILLLLLIFLVVRNLVKLFLERKRKEPGARLKTRLVAGFVGLALMPTLFLFIISMQFISTSVEQWFDANVEQSMRNSLELGKIFYNEAKSGLAQKGQTLADEIGARNLLDPEHRKALNILLEERRRQWGLSYLAVYSVEGAIPTGLYLGDAKIASSLRGLEEAIASVIDSKNTLSEIRSTSRGELALAIAPINASAPSQRQGVVAISARLPRDIADRISRISSGFEEYEQLRMVRRPLKVAHYITLSIMTLLIIFLATWFSFYLARGITGPIQKLVDGTHAIAAGNYDVHIDAEAPDEIGALVASFNRMADDLKQGKAELEKTNKELLQSAFEIDRRRRYMEVTLENVATGVISVDANGVITTINRSAEHILKIRAGKYLHRNFWSVLRSPHGEIVREFIDELNMIKSGSVGRTVKIQIGAETKTLSVNFNRLHDEDGRYIGMVVVFDDLSHIEKAQRASAWREVARRIAHEVKNPLTPIQLSAQRLKKRYRRQISEDPEVFDECTNTIVTQVEELKKLVNEFSSFARMPAANPTPNDISEIIEETVSLYQQAHKDLSFSYVQINKPPSLNLDREQMKRVFINLLDNAVGAFDGGNGSIVVSADFDSILNLVRIEVVDDGPGISPEDKPHLFEPYFSTKKGGTGLGLAIVSTIIADHNGFIRVRDNEPHGIRMIIELPVRT